MNNCKKCGSNSISKRFKSQGNKVYWSEHKEINHLSKFTRNDSYYSSDKIVKECLVYTCKTCGYKGAFKTITLEN